jgi:hypothetical protein
LRRPLVIFGLVLLAVIVVGIAVNLGWHTHSDRTPVRQPTTTSSG